MAWIKVNHETPDKPEVWQIAEILQIDADAVVGKLIRIWSWADQQTVDGNAARVTRALLDRLAGVTGFADAMVRVGWLADDAGGVRIPNFDRHNGETAKKRAQTAKRVERHRAAETQAKRNGNAPRVTDSVQKALPEKEKEKEYINTPLPPERGDASPVSDKPSDASAFAEPSPKRKRKGPIESITRETLADTAALVRWWQFAANCKLVDGSAASRHNVVALAQHCLTSPTVRDPVACFVAGVRDGRFAVPEECDEVARRRLADFDAGKRRQNVAPEIAAAFAAVADKRAARGGDDLQGAA